MIYNFKGKRYRAIGQVKMKNPITRDWSGGILYIEEGKIDQFYVREITEFYDRFKLIKFDSEEAPDGLFSMEGSFSPVPIPKKGSCL